MEHPPKRADEETTSIVPLLIAAAAAGAATMTAELSATRLLAPWFGASIHAWTHVIATVLGAMAIGYAIGSRLALRPSAQLVARGWVIGGILFVIAPFVAPTIAPLLVPSPETQTPITIATDAAWGSFISTLLLFAPAVLMLGASTPILIRLVALRTTDHTAPGRVLAASTIGSLIGTYLPAFFLLESFGSRGSMIVAASLCFLAAALVMSSRIGRSLASISCICLVMLVIGRSWPTLVPSASGDTLVLEKESAYQYVRVSTTAMDGATATNLSLDEGRGEFHSRRLDNAVTTGAYYDVLACLPDLVGGAIPLDVLVIGGGAGTLRGILRSLQNSRVASVTDVELDPIVAGLADRFGGVAVPPDRVVIADGRAALRSMRGPYDIVVLDAYARQAAIPAHLGTVEAIQLMRDRLTRRGILAINASLADVESPLGQALIATLLRVFPEVRTVGVPGSWNVQFLCGPGLPPTPDLKDRGDALDVARGWIRAGWCTHTSVAPGAFVLTDDCAPLETLARKVR